MGYLFLSLSLAAGAIKGYCGKRTSGLVKGTAEATLASTIRMLLCIAVGFFVVALGGDLSSLVPTRSLLAVSALSGVSMSFFVVTWMLAVKKSAYMLVDVFLMLGVLVPIILGKAMFDEPVLTKHIVGLCILVIAVLILCSYNNSIKTRLGFTSFLILVFCGVSNGVADFSQKMFVKTLPEVPASVFNFYTYVFSAAVLLIVWTVFRFVKNGEEKGEFNSRKILPYIAVMSVCLFANSFFKTKAAYFLDSAQLYPLSQGMSLILVTFMASLLFKEKFTLKCALGVTLSFVGLIVINVL